MAAQMCYPGVEYEIDHDGQLAMLKDGGRFVFQFDRSMAGTGCPPALGGFICKRCKEVFDTLDELALHTRGEINHG
jgi:hypothetical protein